MTESIFSTSVSFNLPTLCLWCATSRLKDTFFTENMNEKVISYCIAQYCICIRSASCFYRMEVEGAEKRAVTPRSEMD